MYYVLLCLQISLPPSPLLSPSLPPSPPFSISPPLSPLPSPLSLPPSPLLSLSLSLVYRTSILSTILQLKKLTTQLMANRKSTHPLFCGCCCFQLPIFSWVVWLAVVIYFFKLKPFYAQTIYEPNPSSYINFSIYIIII